MKFARTVTKKQKREASRKKLAIILIVVGLLVLNFVLAYSAFFQKPKPILSPLSKNQISSNEVFEKKLKESNIEYTSITTEKDLSYLIKLKSGGEVLIDQDKDVEEQLSSLQLVLKQLKIEGKTLRRLDFRYQKPIITF
jgi:hypothetical protein